MVVLERRSSGVEATVRSALDGWSGTAESLVAELSEGKHDVRPFDPRTLELCSAVSARLLRLTEHPEAVALGFWMRPAAIGRLQQRFETGIPSDQLIVPRGLAFHVTPANVDTIFIYSWTLSLLVGNANVVRLSSRSTPARARMLEAIAEVFEGPGMGELARHNRFVLTDHGDHTSQVLSAAADVRVIWGGDATVEHFRRFPIPVRGRDITFPDRHSMAVIDTASVAALDDSGVEALADRFFNDAFWFDQGACSSPRLLVWQAAPDPAVTEVAVRRFRAAVLAATKRRGYVAETGMALNKMAFATDVAARFDGVLVESPANEATWVRLPGIEGYDRENCGGGLFFEVVSHDVAADLAEMAGPRDQTVTTFGLERDEVLDIAGRLNGRGVDRFVPVGHALDFDSTWDGLDLLAEFSRRVIVDVGPR